MHFDFKSDFYLFLSVPNPWHFGMDPGPDRAIFVIYFDANKKLI